MNEQKQIYGINLDDYTSPKAIRGKGGYLGTKEDFDAFARALEISGHLDLTIRDAIKAIRAMINGINQEELVKKHGPAFEVIHTLDIYRQLEDITLERQSWQYTTCNDSVYPMYADRVYISRMIVSYGGYQYIAWRVAAEGLCVCLQGSGWAKMSGIVSGHPEIVTYDSKDNIYEMRLYSLGERIDPKDESSIISVLETQTEKGMNYLCRDIIGEGSPRMANPKSAVS